MSQEEGHEEPEGSEEQPPPPPEESAVPAESTGPEGEGAGEPDPEDQIEDE